jgi:hypothetical protein
MDTVRQPISPVFGMIAGLDSHLLSENLDKLLTKFELAIQSKAFDDKHLSFGKQTGVYFSLFIAIVIGH